MIHHPAGRWRERNLIVFKRKHGEKQDHDFEAAENWIVSVWPKIHKRYSASEIYNCDEIGLYFHALPEGTLCFKNDKLSGSKKSKERLTVLLCLLLDNCAAHKIENNGLQFIELVFLPPNTTSYIQPLDQGIIKNFKHYYRRQMLQKIVLTIDADENCTATDVVQSISVLDAVNFMSAAWNDVSADTI